MTIYHPSEGISVCRLVTIKGTSLLTYISTAFYPTYTRYYNHHRLPIPVIDPLTAHHTKAKQNRDNAHQLGECVVCFISSDRHTCTSAF